MRYDVLISRNEAHDRHSAKNPNPNKEGVSLAKVGRCLDLSESLVSKYLFEKSLKMMENGEMLGIFTLLVRVSIGNCRRLARRCSQIRLECQGISLIFSSYLLSDHLFFSSFFHFFFHII